MAALRFGHRAACPCNCAQGDRPQHTNPYITDLAAERRLRRCQAFPVLAKLRACVPPPALRVNPFDSGGMARA